MTIISGVIFIMRYIIHKQSLSKPGDLGPGANIKKKQVNTSRFSVSLFFCRFPFPPLERSRPGALRFARSLWWSRTRGKQGFSLLLSLSLFWFLQCHCVGRSCQIHFDRTVKGSGEWRGRAVALARRGADARWLRWRGDRGFHYIVFWTCLRFWQDKGVIGDFITLRMYFSRRDCGFGRIKGL